MRRPSPVSRRLAPLVLWSAALAAGLGGSACRRPVAGRDFAGAEVEQVKVTPEQVRAGVPIEVRFRLDGGPGAPVTLSLAGKDSSCTPEPLSEGWLRCLLPGLARQDYPEGPAQLVVRAKDRLGRESQSAASVVLDFECPRFLDLRVTPAIASPGATAMLRIEASEPLREPPIVSRAGLLWEDAEGSGSTYALAHLITDRDATATSDVVVRITDLAGNTSGDCGIDGRVPFGVDREPPQVAPELVELDRDLPGQPATLVGRPGAFEDDVGVRAVRVYDEDPTGAPRLIATLVPGADGAVARASLDALPRGRVRVEAVDVADKTSGAVLVRERWRLSVGLGAAARAGIRTAVRYSAAAPGSTAMDERTRELALKIYAADTESAEVAAAVGFRAVGQLPTSYRDTSELLAGYDPGGRAVVAFGGRTKGEEPPRGETLALRFNDLAHEYEPLVLPESPGATPEGRWGVKLAFDGVGCGLMFGGAQPDRLLQDTWRVCADGGSYRWTRLETSPPPAVRSAPLLWDPLLRRYVVASGVGYLGAFDLWFLDPGPGTGGWSWVQLGGIPDDLWSARWRHLFYYEPRFRGYGFGLGFADSSFEEYRFWSYSDGGFSHAEIPEALVGRVGFGWDYDTARSTLAVWGDGADQFVATNAPRPVLDPDTWLLAGDPRTGAQAWRRTNLGPSVVRGFPSVVYDADREATIVFGGVRTLDQTSVAPAIEEMVLAPSYPQLQATLDLGAGRPRGIESLRLALRALGSGDGDGVGPGAARAGGLTVLLWNHEASRWEEVRSVDTPAAGAPVDLPVEITDRPERFVSLDGVVPITLVPRWPATEDVEGRLSVDLVDGHLALAADLPRGARIESFSATPAHVVRGRPVTVEWSVSGAADGVELFADGARVLTSTRSAGSIETVPDTTTTYELRAKDARDGGASARRRVTVRAAEAPPLVREFTAGKRAAPRGGSVRLAWRTERASLVRVLRGRTEVYASADLAAEGLYDAAIPLTTTMTSTTFTLEAKSEAGRELREVHVRLAHPRIQRGPGTSGAWTGAIAPAGEHDLYVVELSTPGYLDATLWVPSARQCAAGPYTYVALYDARLDPVTSADGGSLGDCARLDPAEDRSLLLGAGTYYLDVSEYYDSTSIPAYELELTLTPVACGNGRREPGEACDDGNTTSGDGCSAACGFEANAVYTAPGDGRATQAGTIGRVGETDSYQLDVTAPAYVTLETFAPDEASGCATADTYLELYASDGTTSIARDDDSGLGYCSFLGQPLAPGTYYAVVREYGDDGLIPAYALVLDATGAFDPEAEPNDDAARAMPLGALGPGDSSPEIAAAIAPAGDVDWFAFELTAAAAVTVTTYTQPGARTACDTADTQLTLYDSAGLELAFDDDGGAGYCSLLDGLPPLPAGTYYARVNDYGDDGVIASYFVDVQAR